jgi:hypothetical protein
LRTLNVLNGPFATSDHVPNAPFATTPGEAGLSREAGLYWTGQSYVDIPATYDVAADRYVHTDFTSVTTTRMRAVLVGETASVGALPATVTRVYADGTRLDSPVTWAPITRAQVKHPGTFTVPGVTTDTPLIVEATVDVTRGHS